MKIILKPGIPNTKNRHYTVTCDECACIFRFKFTDLIKEKSFRGEINYSIKCPQKDCENEFYPELDKWD